MLRRLRNSDGKPSGLVRLLAALLILALGFGMIVTALAVLAPVFRWMFPALF